jgi:hypothetical protein
MTTSKGSTGAQGKSGPPSATDFENMSHEQLHSMLADANSGHVGDLATHLSTVSTHINQVAHDLKAHVNALVYEGKGSDAFRDWTNQTANATLKLGTYAQNASSYMTHASSAIGDAHGGMPPLSETTGAQQMLHEATTQMTDGSTADADKRAAIASTRIETTRQEAIKQMRSLASSYSTAGQQINSLAPPTFPPPANSMDGWHEPNSYVALSGPGSDGSALPLTNGGPGGGGVTNARTSHSVVTSPGGGSQPHEPQLIPSGNHTPDTRLDSAAPPLVTQAPPLTHQPPPTQGPPTDTPPVTMVPPPFGVPMGTGPGGSKEMLGPGGRLPGGPGSGENDLGPQRLVRPTVAQDSGIVGGQRVENSNRQSTGLPRGTVVDGQDSGTATSRSPMMGRSMGGLGRGGGFSGSSGVIGGRRLATEPGGVVGRVPEAEEISGRPFTPGGSGLVRPEAADGETEAQRQSNMSRGGMMPGGVRGGLRDPQEERGHRPDYLKEDEETWQQGDGPTVPGVIE